MTLTSSPSPVGLATDYFPRLALISVARLYCKIYMLGSASMSDGTIYEHPIPDLEQQKVKSWRYIGYRGFSEWSASAQDFLVVRRFDSLAARVIFLLQWEITKLESGLTEMDEVRMYGAKDDLNNGSFECDDEDRQFQIKTIKAKLEDYCEYSEQEFPTIHQCEILEA